MTLPPLSDEELADLHRGAALGMLARDFSGADSLVLRLLAEHAALRARVAELGAEVDVAARLAAARGDSLAAAETALRQAQADLSRERVATGQADLLRATLREALSLTADAPDEDIARGVRQVVAALDQAAGDDVGRADAVSAVMLERDDLHEQLRQAQAERDAAREREARLVAWLRSTAAIDDLVITVQSETGLPADDDGDDRAGEVAGAVLDRIVEVFTGPPPDEVLCVYCGADYHRSADCLAAPGAVERPTPAPATDSEEVARDANVCEHGDHPAPPGKRFCSRACAECERADCDDSEECAGICLRPWCRACDHPAHPAGLCMRPSNRVPEHPCSCRVITTQEEADRG